MRKGISLIIMLVAGLPFAVYAEEPVYFADANLKAAVEDALGITNPTPTDMLQLTNLRADGSGIVDLNGLQYATNLQTLGLSRNQIGDISLISVLTEMLWLSIGGNQISDISAIEELTNLQELVLSRNQISDISPLSGLTNLEILLLTSNKISDISPLSGLTNVRELNLNDNIISNISPLSGHTNLEKLYLLGNLLGADAYNIYIPLLESYGTIVYCDPPIWRTLTISSTTGGSIIEPGEGDFKYINSTIVNVNAVNDPGYYFVEWKGTAVNTGSVADPYSADTTMTMDADYTLQANFEQVRIIYVDDDATKTNDGTSWENAYVYLQDALAEAGTAKKPVEVRVAQGIYTPDQGVGQTHGDQYATFGLINCVILKGGFAGLREPDPNERDVELYETILSGDLNGDDVDVNNPSDLFREPNRFDNSGIVIKGSGADITAVLDGFTITGGAISIISSFDPRRGGSGSPYGGAGMYINSGSPTLTDCTFTDNVTGNFGGGLLVYNGNPTMTNCTFIRNYAFSGGGMYSSKNSCPTLLNCTFSDNFAQFKGGGMLNTSCNPTLTDCTFIDNLADTGGGMFNEDCNSVLNTCEFVCNTALHYSGAIININGQLIAKGCVFEKNYPGAITTGSSNTFINCIFSGNTSQLQGGAVQVHMATFNHCIFDGNKSLKYYLNDGTLNPSIGGAVFSRSIVAFNNCTFTNNQADFGSAMYCRDTAFVNNCIFWGSEDQIRTSTGGQYPSVNYSNIQGGWDGVGNIDADPLFINPGYWADVNDPNIIAEPNDPNAVWINGDYHLKSQAGRFDPNSGSFVIDDVTSPCIDAGDPNSPVSDEPEPNGGRINMGAYGGTDEAGKSYLDESP